MRWYLVGFSASFLVLGTLALLLFVPTPPFERSLERGSTNAPYESHRAITNANQATTRKVDAPQSDFGKLVNSLRKLGRFSGDVILYEHLADASLEDLVKIGKRTQDVQPPSLRHQLQTVLVRRMCIEDFEQAMTALSTISESTRGPLIEETFAEWAITDLNAAIDHARELNEFNRLYAVRGILSGSRDLPRIELSAIAHSLGHDQKVYDHIALEISDAGIANPATSWNEFLSVFGDSLGELSETQRHVLVEIAAAWIGHNEAEAIQAIRQLPGIESGRRSIAASLLAGIAEDNLVYALELATELGIQNRKTLIDAVKSVAEQQPQSVFLAVSNYEKQGIRRVLQRFVIESWAETDPLDLIEFLESLPKDLFLWGEENAFLGLARIDPQHAAEAIQSLKRQSSRKSVSLEVARYWSRIDPEGAFSWSMSDEAVSGWKVLLQETILKELTEEDPETALELALSQHVSENEVGLEATVIEGLVEIDIEKAETMLERTRNQPTREASFSAIGNALIIRGRTVQALELVKEESAEFQAVYFDSIGSIWAYFDPSDLFTKIESLPTDEVKKNLAVKLAFVNSAKAFLTSEQKKVLTQYLPSAMQGMLE